MGLIFLLFINFSFAEEELISEKYCYPSTHTRLQAENKFRAFKVISDEVRVDDDCLIIHMKPHRQELISRYFLTQIPHSKLSFSSGQLAQEPCLIKVEKEIISTSDGVDLNLKSRSSLTHLSTQNHSKQVMIIKTLKNFSLTSNQEEISGECRFQNKDSYLVSITVSKNPRPIYPGTLPSSPPPDEVTSSLTTQIQLARGSRMEIASIVRDLRNKGREINNKPKLVIQSRNGKEEERVYLSID